MVFFDIKEELCKLPDGPGVYLMYNSRGEVIYVGKAVNLRRRVSSYFHGTTRRGPKIETMVSQIVRFEYIMTDSELEALILECNLIKEYRPKYNTMLMDDKSYPYVSVTMSEDFPRIISARRISKDGNKYFGPFTSSRAVKNTINLLRKLYGIRNCTKKLTACDDGSANINGKVCLYYHIGQCPGVCQGEITKEEYHRKIEGSVKFLEGSYTKVTEELYEKMYNASENQEYEKAKEYKDLIDSINHVAGDQKITSNRMEDRDVIACARDENAAVVQIFFIRNGKLIGRDHFFMNASLEDENRDILTEFIKQYYVGIPFVPRQLLIMEEVDEQDLLAQMLGRNQRHNVKITVPKRGSNEKLMELAVRNAENLLTQNKERYRAEEKKTIGAAAELAGLLGIDSIRRMESYDISNTGGFQSVASMVVFERGKPKKNSYRKFKIKTVVGPDDYASMREVLDRRFRRGIEERKSIDFDEDYTGGNFSDFPDLILMDGGKGQVNSAKQVLERYGLDIPVCGMVKDDRHRTRGLYYNNEEIPIDVHSDSFKLITRIQDETHRFAITYHRNLREKASVHSVLDDIRGVGPVRRRALMRTYNSIEDIKNATVEELREIPEINDATAENIYKFFRE